MDKVDQHFELLSCVDCHNGNSKQPNNKELAHLGLVKDPSEFDADGKNSCSKSGCHEDIAGNYKNSLHQKLWGEKRMVALRFGKQSFGQCPKETRDGYSSECTDCHATCGDCHISIPNSAGQGFVSSHRFNRTPDQKNNCTACHGSRIAHDFFGDYDAVPERLPDVHSSSHNCLSCHSMAEMHSAVSDTAETHRYNYANLPSCEEGGCHDDNLSTKNLYHTTHFDSISCFVCHAQDYNNCTACHVKGEWKTDPNYQNNNPAEDFRIGLNPLRTQSEQHRFKFVTLRHIPIARDSYANWGAASDNPSDYDQFPTWKYTSPHSILRFTARTDTSGGKSCYESCHTKTGFGNPENKKLFLFSEYLQNNWPDEVNANLGVVVDGKLPDGWE